MQVHAQILLPLLLQDSLTQREVSGATPKSLNTRIQSWVKGVQPEILGVEEKY